MIILCFLQVKSFLQEATHRSIYIHFQAFDTAKKSRNLLFANISP